MVIDKITIGPEIGLIAGNITKIIIEEITPVIEVIENIDPITEIVVGLERETTIEMGTGATTDQTTEGTVVTKGIETEVYIRIVAGPGKEIGAVQEKVPNLEVEINTIEIRVEMVAGDRVEIIQETEKIDPDLSQGQDQATMSAQTGIDVNAIDAMNMIILQGNALM